MRAPVRLDKIIHYFQESMPSFDLHRLSDDVSDSVLWMTVEGSAVVSELIVNELDVPVEVDRCPMQLAYWGRMVALCRRVVELHERRYRVWRAEQWERVLNEAAKAEEKKPTDRTIESKIRRMSEYNTLKDAIARAEESRDACEMIVEGFRAKTSLLTSHAPLYRELAGMGG